METIIVIILNYNSSKDSIALYQELKNYYKGIAVLVIDNNSSLSEQHLLKAAICVDDLILNTQNRGYAGGNNIGIQKAIEQGREYVWILNPDIRVTKKTLPILLETIKKDTTIAAVGPRICFRNNPSKIYSDGGIIVKEAGFATSHRNCNKDIAEITNQSAIFETAYVNGSVLLIRTAILKKIGMLLEDFFLYFEETEWCLRATQNKFKLLVNTNALAYHAASKKGELYHYYMTRNRILLAKYQHEFYRRTIGVVLKKVVRKMIQDIMHLQYSAKTRSMQKGFLSGITHKLEK